MGGVGWARKGETYSEKNEHITNANGERNCRNWLDYRKFGVLLAQR